MTAPPSSAPGTSTQIMNMKKSRSGAASTISTILNPIKKTFRIKKRLSKRGTNALFRAISAENWELVCSVCDTKPYKAEVWHNAVGFFDAHRSSRILPLHQACIFHPSKEAIIHIIQAYPYALQSKESGYGRVPLHIACHSNASLECIQALVSHFPGASIEQDVIGRVPIHYALSNGATYEILMTLLNAATQVYGPGGKRHVCSVADFNGWLPIHVACFMGASPRVLSEIVKAYPEGVDAATKKDSTPKGLLKGITMSPEKKKKLISVLANRGITQNRGYASRVSPVRTNMEKVVQMSDETCSKGVTLEIDEDETSSLSSMETARTGLTKKSRSRRRLTYDEYRHIDPTIPMSSHRPSHRKSFPQLPTHSAYDEEIEQPSPILAHHGYEYPRRDLYYLPEKGPKIRNDTDATQSHASTDDDDDSCGDAVFQPITSTAAFC